jgi:hypothetical protein
MICEDNWYLRAAAVEERTVHVWLADAYPHYAQTYGAWLH